MPIKKKEGPGEDGAQKKSSELSDLIVTRSRTKRAKPSTRKSQPPNGMSLLIVSNEPPPSDTGEESSLANEYSKFIAKLRPKDRKELKTIETEVMCYDDDRQPLKYRILKSGMPVSVKYAALTCLNTLETMRVDDAEYHKRLEYLNRLCSIPFGKYIDLPVSLKDSAVNIHRYLHDIRATMDEQLYGMAAAKNTMVEIIGQSITNPNTICNAIGLHGDFGVGKTEFVKCAVAKVLNRPFHFIGLGGSRDSSSFVGHDWTYTSARWGILADILMRSRTMSTVILFDELDKVSDTPQGQEITGLLTHLIDPSQNTCIQDRYFANTPLDFSRCIFFFSFNDRSKVDPVLLDRIKVLHVPGYKMHEKLVIAQRYLLPRLFANIGMDQDTVILTDQDIKYIIETYCPNESGMRTLKKVLETLLFKINAIMLTNTSRCERMYNIDIGPPPCIMHQDIIDTLLKDFNTDGARRDVPFGMYV